MLNEEQQEALSYVKGAKNLFLSGCAGTGKSFLLSRLVEELRAMGKQVAVTATTGIAAIQIGGSTVHSFAGFGIGDQSPAELKRLVLSTAKFRSIFGPEHLNTLFIDEISMLSVDYFEKLNLVAQEARGNRKPMGGLQVILAGDFLQLPPVRTDTSLNSKKKPVQYCFESPVWTSLRMSYVELTQVFRQKDPRFVGLLSHARSGHLTDGDLMVLSSRLLVAPLVSKDSGIEPSVLCSRLEEVHRVNRQRLEEIKAPVRDFWRIHGVSGQVQVPHWRVEKAIRDLENSAPAVEHLTLKEGAQVMLLVNLSAENELMNGSRGVIVGFTQDERKKHDKEKEPDPKPNYPIVRFAKVEVVIRAQMWKTYLSKTCYVYVAQIPLNLAFACSIHKSQGQSLDCVSLSLDKSVWEFGQAYTALSRVRSLSALYLKSCDASCIRASEKVLKFYEKLDMDKKRGQRNDVESEESQSDDPEAAAEDDTETRDEKTQDGNEEEDQQPEPEDEEKVLEKSEPIEAMETMDTEPEDEEEVLEKSEAIEAMETMDTEPEDEEAYKKPQEVFEEQDEDVEIVGSGSSDGDSSESDEPVLKKPRASRGSE